jgi:hypothetical protein
MLLIKNTLKTLLNKNISKMLKNLMKIIQSSQESESKNGYLNFLVKYLFKMTDQKFVFPSGWLLTLSSQIKGLKGQQISHI